MCASLTFDDIHPLAIGIEKLSNLFDLMEKYKLKSTIFVTPFYKEKKIGEYKEYVKLLKNFLDNGNEIGMHGYRHTRYEFGYPTDIGLPIEIPFPSFGNQIEKLRKSVNILGDTFHTEIYGFRSPGYGHNNSTIRALSKLGFKYDSSKVSFKPAHIPRHGIRIKTFIKPYPYIVNGNMKEIPVVGDYTYNLGNGEEDFVHSMENMKKDSEFVYEKGGKFVINNHIQCTSVDYEKFLKYLIDTNKFRFCRLIDIIDNEDIVDNGNITNNVNV